MKTALKYYVGINVKADRRQVFGVHGTPTARSHGKHFSAVIGPFSNLRAALYVRDRGFNNPSIRCPADAEKLCRVRSGPTYQRTAAKLKRRRRRQRSAVSGQRRKGRRKGRARLRRALKSPRRRNPVSKLRSGERQGDIFARVQEPFRLAGEKGTDHARLQAERQAKAKSARDFATRRQLDFETNPRRRGQKSAVRSQKRRRKR